MLVACTLLSLLFPAAALAADTGSAPSSACPSGSLREAQGVFQAAYKAKKFGQAVTTLEPAFSRCESTLSPDQRARILSDLAIAAFHSGDKKLCLKFIDRVPGNASSSSKVAFALENNRRLCAGESWTAETSDCRQTNTTDDENSCADQLLEGARRQLKRAMKAAEEKLRATANGSISAWNKEFLKANRASLKLIKHDCGPLFTLEFGPWGTGFNAAQADCELSHIKEWTQDIQNRFALPGHVPEQPTKLTPCSDVNVFDCPAIREVEKKREARFKAAMTEKPQIYQESELTASQQIAAWRRNIGLHQQLWLAWRQSWCVSSLVAEMLARDGGESKAPPIDAEASCLVQVTDIVDPPEQPVPTITKPKPSPVPAPALACIPLPPNAGVRFDGLYQGGPTAESLGSQHPWLSYLRFYADGSVFLAASDGGPQKVASWLDKNHKEHRPACATANSGKLQIVRVLPEGKVEYTGSAKGTDLVLHVVNGISGRQTDAIYQFTSVHFGDEAPK
jgi:uncharacterized protein YecT (DUF1311 family)